MPRTTDRRSTSNANERGNNRDRARRKRNLLERDGTGPDGWALCVTCPIVVDFESMTVDRIVPGCLGGKYGPPTDLSNCRIQCERCSRKQGGTYGQERKRARRAERVAA